MKPKVFPKNKQTDPGLGFTLETKQPVKTYFTNAHRFIADFENESTFTAILEAPEQLIEACRHIGGVFCSGCDLWDETGLDWKMFPDNGESGTNIWFCGACCLKEANEEKTTTNIKSIKEIMKPAATTEQDFCFDKESDFFTSDNQGVSSQNSNILEKMVSFVTTSSSTKEANTASRYLISSSSIYSAFGINKEEHLNLVEEPFRKKKR